MSDAASEILILKWREVRDFELPETFMIDTSKLEYLSVYRLPAIDYRSLRQIDLTQKVYFETTDVRLLYLNVSAESDSQTV